MENKNDSSVSIEIKKGRGRQCRYDDLYSMDMFGESTEGHKYTTPYYSLKRINPNSKEDMKMLREVLRNNYFDDEDE